ncbi:unnamed protein product [Vicia faba]|uniref:ATP-dependent RNA helicase n=1 Tax=Vicia faba TaxID=3906 RepID=A0AAV1A849_VICFA|nr:unnamed protein product [Vicia faba]
MAGVAPKGSQFDAKQFDTKMNELLTTEGQDFYTFYEEVFESFNSMGLQENLLRGIYAYGFEKPSAIQQHGIVPFCKGLDVIQQAQSGTGKTAVLSEIELLIIKVKVSTTPDGKVLDLFFYHRYQRSSTYKDEKG